MLLFLREIEATYGGGMEKEGVSRDEALAKLFEVADLAKKQGIALRKSKRYLDLFRGISGFGASRATFFAEVVGRAPAADRAAVEAHTARLCAAIRNAADRILGAT